MGRAVVGGTAIVVVIFLRPIDRDAHQPTVVVEEPAPFVVEQGPVGLDAVAHTTTFGISSLISQRLAIETNRQNRMSICKQILHGNHLSFFKTALRDGEAGRCTMQPAMSLLLLP